MAEGGPSGFKFDAPEDTAIRSDNRNKDLKAAILRSQEEIAAMKRDYVAAKRKNNTEKMRELEEVITAEREEIKLMRETGIVLREDESGDN